MIASLAYDQARPPYRSELGLWVRDRLAGRSVRRTLDIGCGTGRSSRWARSFSQQVTGVDPSPDMISLARSLNADPDITFRLGSAEALGVKIEPVDLVLSCGAFEWFDKALFARQLRRVLHPGGPIVIVWSWLEPLDEVTNHWFWIMRRLLGAQVGPDPDDCTAMVQALCPNQCSSIVLRSAHLYKPQQLHDLLHSSSYWRPHPHRLRESHILIDRFTREVSPDDVTTRLVFREVGFLGHLEP